MKAAVIQGPDRAPTYGDFAEPQCVDGTEVFDLVGAGVHRVVRSLASGTHYGSSGVYPHVVGIDAVARGADGGLVYTGRITPPWGTMAERMAAAGGFPVPDDADPLAVAAGVNPAGSSWLPLHRHRDQRGAVGSVLVLGATGMSGQLAVQAAQLLGASSIVAVGRNRAVLDDLASRGATAVSLTVDDPVSALTDAIADSPPNLVLDYLWGPVAEAAFAALARHGLDEDDTEISYVQIGALAGLTSSVPAALLRSRNITVSGSGAGSVSAAQSMASIPAVIEQIANGGLRVPYRAYRLAEIESAWTHDGPARAVVTP